MFANFSSTFHRVEYTLAISKQWNCSIPITWQISSRNHELIISNHLKILSEVRATMWVSSAYPGCQLTSVAVIFECPWKNLAPINVHLTRITGREVNRVSKKMLTRTSNVSLRKTRSQRICRTCTSFSSSCLDWSGNKKRCHARTKYTAR